MLEKIILVSIATEKLRDTSINWTNYISNIKFVKWNKDTYIPSSSLGCYSTNPTVSFLNFFFEKSVLRWSGTSGSTQVTTYYLQCRHNIRIWDRKGADLTNFYMSNLCPADYHHCKMWEKTSHDMKKWDLFIGPGCGFEDSKAFVDRSLFIVEKLQFVIFF